ncbi:MAG: outer membrane protein assembly factor BamD [Acidobacteriales bacterium]|nr:outer membrane protein assembly factor BamD [Terriglobales bacterium]
MRLLRYFLFAVLACCLVLAPNRSWAVSKEIIQLQTQVAAMQDQMTQMKQSFDERMGVMQHLVEQDTDNVNKVAAALGTLQETLQKQQGDSSTHVDQLSSQIQALNDSIDELRARLTKVSQQLDALQAAQQNLSTQSPAATQPQSQAPPPDVLYNNAVRDYNAGKNDLATQEFSDFVKFYPNTDLAGNAYYYLADIAYRAQNYSEAVKNYDEVLQNFPTGDKAASAQLKKGLALIELGKKDDGIAELRHLIQRFPKSPEALQARDRLRKLGVSVTGSASRR